LGGGGDSYLSRGSTGRTVPRNAAEAKAMEKVMQNPSAGRQLEIKLKDPRWPSSEGWVKMTQRINSIEIHYVWNKALSVYGDFKFK
jgi:filamentous hemagglutinin